MSSTNAEWRCQAIGSPLLLPAGATGRPHEQIDIYYLISPFGSSVRVHASDQNIQSVVGHREVSSPTQSKGLEPVYWSITSR